MDGWAFARLAAIIIIVAVAATAAAVHLAQQDATTVPPPPPTTTGETPRIDPLPARLQHCRELGEAATRDTNCLAAWGENRRRFLAPSEVQ